MGEFEPNPALIRELAGLLKETGLNEIEYAEGDRRIRVSSSFPANTSLAPAAITQHVDQPFTKEEVKPKSTTGLTVESPMVGTVYLAPEPGKPPFVKIGDTVKQGDTLLIIEAMKVMNPIKAAKGGVILEILVTDAKPVEFGETLMVIS